MQPYDLNSILNNTFRPGFLMTPLGWLTEPLTTALKGDPDLLASVLELDEYRMHALALTFAISNPNPPSLSNITALLAGNPNAALEHVLGNWPPGLRRVLQNLAGASVLAIESYRKLVFAIHDKPTATFLRHRRDITEPLILALAALPSPLRTSAVFKLLDYIDGIDRFVPGLMHLCELADLSFDDFCKEIGALGHPDQVKAKVAAIIDRLPLPDRLPNEQIGHFRRVDEPAQIRALARSWKNCLADHIREVNEGASLVYLSPDKANEAAALLSRINRIGWAVVDIKGPRNIEIKPELLAKYYDTFRSANVSRLSDVAAIRSIIWRHQLSRI
ncbi:MAG TPA: hypothetical protein VH206_01295 [Xanthobacteraceae bacterium]|jgi:hypothetical protein|nr:hypothetical protein [Xanthobacteraceae bacterium]